MCPGCRVGSQGSTEEEALANIHDAIQEYLAAVDDLTKSAEVREIEVGSKPVAKIPGVNHPNAVRALE